MQDKLNEILSKYLFEENSDLTRFYIKKELDSFLSSQITQRVIREYLVEPIPLENDFPSKLSIKVFITLRNRKKAVYCLSINTTNIQKKSKFDKY
jgi:hypothetical protein